MTDTPHHRDFNAPPKLPGTPFLEAALSFAKSGKPVFPCNPSNKKPYTTNGFKDATTDPKIIKKWATEHPIAMIGIPTGEVTGVTVYDFDPQCEITADQMLPGMPHTRTHGTPSGGVHKLFKYTPDVGTIGTGVIPLPEGLCVCKYEAEKKCQIDLRSDGGYIIVPPSVRADGKAYTLLSKAKPVEMPKEFLQKLSTGKREKARAMSNPGEMFPEGQRNESLASLAGTMHRKGISQATIETALQAENLQRCNPPLPEHEVTSIAASISRYPVGDSNLPSQLVNSDNSLVRKEEIYSEKDFSDLQNETTKNLSFPVDSLPEVVKRYCVESAEAIGVPVEMVAAPLIAYAGAAIGRNQRIQLKRGFVQYPVLWVVTVANPGAAKTPADDAARVGINHLQTESKIRFDAEEEIYKRDIQLWKDSTSNETRGAMPTPPELEHFYSTDTTMEGLCRNLENSPGIALACDEIVSFVNSMNQYKGGKGAERTQHLSAFSGAPIKVDRKTSATLLIEHPVVPIIGGVQPDVMNELAAEAGRRDGFLERMLWIVPSAKPAPWSDDETSLEAINSIVSLFRRLRHPEPSPNPVTLSRGAYKIFTSWYNENQNSIPESAGMMQGVYAKMSLQLARITLILHCLEHPDSPDSQKVTAKAMAAAIDLVEYFRGQAGLALMMIGVGSKYRGSGTTAKLFQTLTKAEGEWRSRTKLHQDLGGHTAADEITKALTELEGEGLAEKRRPEGSSGGGRRGEEWRINTLRTNELSELTSLEHVENSQNGVTTEVTI